MPRATPTFPAFDEWRQMTESEQDALLDRFETVQRRRAMAGRLLVGLACVSGLALSGAALIALW
jgi:hypothetical protein